MVQSYTNETKYLHQKLLNQGGGQWEISINSVPSKGSGMHDSKNYSHKTLKKHIKNVKGCRDGMPKITQTR